MQTNTSRTSPTPGASAAAINAQDAAMKGSDVLQIPLAELFAHNPAMRIDWDRKTLAFEFNFNDANGTADAINDAAQCIQNLCGVPDGTSRQTILVQANRVDAESANNSCDNVQPRPCQIHEAQNARAAASSAPGSGTSTTTPRGIRPLPRRSQILNGPGGGAPTTASPNPSPNPNPTPSATQAGATYDNTNTARASSGDDDDDDIPLDVLKREVIARRKRKAKAAAAIFEPVIKKEPIEKEPGKLLHPGRHQFKIRDLDEHVRWYYTKSIRPIDAVPANLLKPHHEALYVHRYKSPFVGRQIWIFIKHERAQPGAGDAGADAGGSTGNRNGNPGEGEGMQDGEWRRVEVGDPHPRLEGLVLHMLDGNGPRWVKPKSARSYASGKHKRERWAKSM